jgi:hypothetical protein
MKYKSILIKASNGTVSTWHRLAVGIKPHFKSRYNRPNNIATSTNRNLHQERKENSKQMNNYKIKIQAK